MQVWGSVLLAALQIGAKLLERVDRDSYDAFRRALGADALGVLGSQLGEDTLTTIHAYTDKSENCGSGRGEGMVDR